MKKILTLAVCALVFASPAYAEHDHRVQDSVSMTLATEGWVNTKTALAQVGVDAAVTGANAGKLRMDMQKAVNGLAPSSEWRLISFNRSQDSSGLERWNATYEARLADSDLNGLHERAKASSKAGMQLNVQYISFQPTLAEYEAKKSDLRSDIYKQASAELAKLNAGLPGRNYRIGDINFTGMRSVMQPMMAKNMRAEMAYMAADGAVANASGGGEPVAEKLNLDAVVTFVAPGPKE